eukprot:PhM_4_TR9547/c2_g2_i1/m.34201
MSELKKSFFGPALYFVGRENTTWNLRIVTVAKIGTTSSLDLHIKEQPFAKIVSSETFDIMGVDLWVVSVHVVAVEMAPDAPRIVRYTSTVTGQAPEPFDFKVPAASKEPKTLYFSCNDIPTPQIRNMFPRRYAGWDFISTEFGLDDKRFELAIGGGDQIYADEIFEKLFTNGRDMAYPLILDYYINEYVRRFHDDDPNMRRMLATVPFFMQCDDHDFYNGYSSYTYKRRPPHSVSIAAQTARMVFQLGQRPTINESTETLNNTSRVAQLGPNVVMLNLDFRSNRDMEQKRMMFDKDFDRVLAEAAALCGKTRCQHLMVLFASPVVWSHSKRREWVSSWIKNIPMMSILATDSLDSFRSEAYIGQGTRMLHELFRVAKENKLRLTFVSGDIHNGAYGTLVAKGASESNYRYAQQWISSSLCNLPIPETWGSWLWRKTWGVPSGYTDETFEFKALPGDDAPLVAHLEQAVWGTQNFLVIESCSETKTLTGQLWNNSGMGKTDFTPNTPVWKTAPPAQ